MQHGKIGFDLSTTSLCSLAIFQQRAKHLKKMLSIFQLQRLMSIKRFHLFRGYGKRRRNTMKKKPTTVHLLLALRQSFLLEIE